MSGGDWPPSGRRAARAPQEGEIGARGEAGVMLGGVRRRVCLTLGALAEIETGLGVEGLAAAAERMKALSARDLMVVLAARGFTAFVLFYRLPGEGWAAGPDVALADAQRAMRLIRARAGDFAVDPERVSAMGFSAGGHLCADLATRFDASVYAPVDAADQLSAKPHSAAPIYPVISMTAPDAHPGSRELLVGKNATPALEAAHSPHLNVPADAPPVFLLHAEDDDVVPVNNALLLRAALKAKGARVETHLFEHGGHGFGLRKAIGKPVEAWPELWRAWARTTGLAL